VHFGCFRAAPLGGFPSLHPSYPPALGLITYFASVLTGDFAEAAGPLTNVLLTLLAAGSVHRLLGRSLEEPGSGFTRVPYWSAALLLTPAVQWVRYWSALADPAIGVVVLVTIIRWCEYMAQPGESERTHKRRLLTILLLGALISGIKHSGWQIAVVMAAAGALAMPMHFASLMLAYLGTGFADWEIARAA
jgi:hypothetical protein